MFKKIFIFGTIIIFLIGLFLFLWVNFQKQTQKIQIPETQPEKSETQPPEKSESQPPEKLESQPPEKSESQPPEKSETQPSNETYLPRFEDYPVKEIFQGPPAPVDFTRLPEPGPMSPGRAVDFDQWLIEKAKEGPNFAGHYTLIEWGCGTECQNHMIIDAITGKGYSLPAYSEENPHNHLITTRGVSVRLDSRLLIADPPCGPYPPQLTSCRGGGATNPVRFFLMEEDGLRLIYVLNCKIEIVECENEKREGECFEENGKLIMIRQKCEREYDKVIIIEPRANAVWLRGEVYSIEWRGGSAKVKLFLVDKSSGAIIKKLDVDNEGYYLYKVPPELKPGIYKWCINGGLMVCTDYFIIK
jgi:hypothetical protein